jgi:hypothetical protein
VVLLLWIWPRLLDTPFFDSWAFVKQYQTWTEGHYGWADLFAAHNMHPSVPGKLIYFVTMHWLRGHVACLPLLSWLLSVGIALSVQNLAAPLWQTHPERRPWILLLANATIFTATMERVWLWDFVFQNIIPGACLAAGLWLLQRNSPPLLKLGLAATLSLIAAFAFASGFLVVWLLLPMVWLTHPADGKRKCLLGGATFALLLTITVLKARGPGPSATEGLELLASQPWMSFLHFLILLAGPIGGGTSLDAELQRPLLAVPALALAALAIWQLRNRRELWVQAWPWLACIAYALINAVIITMGRMRFSTMTALPERYIPIMMFFLLGVTLLACLVWRDTRLPRPLPVVLCTLLITLHALNGITGFQGMERYHLWQLQGRAALSFVPILGRMIDDPSFTSIATDDWLPVIKLLHEQRKLHDVPLFTDPSPASFKQSKPATNRNIRFDTLVREPTSGNLIAKGLWAPRRVDAGIPPDLIVITSSTPDGKDERIIACHGPTLPEDYFQSQLRRHDYADHYYGWEVRLAQTPEPAAGAKLRAYGFDQDSRRLCLIPGEHLVP